MTTNNTINPNLLSSLYQSQAVPSLQLTQIDGYEPLPEFTDSSGVRWRLVKAANSGMSEIPDPQSVNVTDYWNHEYPGSGGKVFVYVVEGVRVPKTTREAACNVLYCWFSTVDNKQFTPQMIRPNEWLMANVYASPVTDARVSKLKALCKVRDDAPAVMPQTGTEKFEQAPLISQEILNGNESRNTTVRQTTGNNKGKCSADNR